MAQRVATTQKLSREERKNLNLVRLFEKSEKTMIKKEIKDRTSRCQNPIIIQNPKKKAKTDSNVLSDGLSTTNLNQYSSNSFEIVQYDQKPQCSVTQKAQIVNSSYGISMTFISLDESQLFFHLLQYRNAQKQKINLKQVDCCDVLVSVQQDATCIELCSEQILQKTNNAFRKISQFFNVAKPTIRSMHQFKLRPFLKH